MMKPLLAVSLVVFSLFGLNAFAEDEPRYEEGKHYTLLSNPVKTTYRGDEIGEIMEFFSMSCIHCYHLEPGIERFLKEKPDNIRFTQVPVIFNNRQEPEARAFYVAEIMNLKKAQPAIFERNFVERKPFRNDQDYAKFFTQFGMTEDEYMGKALSFAVDSKIKNAMYLTGTSAITGTPSIVVNGKYQIETGVVGGNETALYVAKWLIENEAKKAQ
ncbi:MAG: thiol:disulfide interchange protein DsbA/DsbL [Reinekea sp.]